MKDMLSSEHFERVWSRVAPWDHGEAACRRENGHLEEACCPYHDDPRFRKCVFLAERLEEERLLLDGLCRCHAEELRCFLSQARHRIHRLQCAICRISGEPYPLGRQIFSPCWYRCCRKELKWLNEHLILAYSGTAGEGIWERELPLLREFVEEHRKLQEALRQ